jgi:hypothetical protein
MIRANPTFIHFDTSYINEFAQNAASFLQNSNEGENYQA